MSEYISKHFGLREKAIFALSMIGSLPFSAVLFYQFINPIKRKPLALFQFWRSKPIQLNCGQQSTRLSNLTGVVSVNVFKDERGNDMANVQVKPDDESKIDVVIKDNRYARLATPSFRVDENHRYLILETPGTTGKEISESRAVAMFQYVPDDKI